MIVKPGSQADCRRRHRAVKKALIGEITSDSQREAYFEEKAKRQKKNKEALQYYIKCLQKELSSEEISIVSPVFDLWQKNKFCRNAILAHNDIERVFCSRCDEAIEQKLMKCQMKLMLFMNL